MVKQEHQRTGVNTNKYITSFMGLSPTEDPELVILVVLYNPTGEGGHQGGAWVILTTHTKTIKKSIKVYTIKSGESN